MEGMDDQREHGGEGEGEEGGEEEEEGGGGESEGEEGGGGGGEEEEIGGDYEVIININSINDIVIQIISPHQLTRLIHHPHSINLLPFIIIITTDRHPLRLQSSTLHTRHAAQSSPLRARDAVQEFVQDGDEVVSGDDEG